MLHSILIQAMERFGEQGLGRCLHNSRKSANRTRAIAENYTFALKISNHSSG